MENLSWGGQPLQQFLDSSNSAHVTEVEKVLVQITKGVRRAKLRLKSEQLLQKQYAECKDSFRAKIQPEPLQNCELATKLFQYLQGVGMVLYGYIHRTKGLEAQFLELDDEDIDLFMKSISVFLKAELEQKNPGVRGIYFWVSIQDDMNACSDVLPEDLENSKIKMKQIDVRNERRRLKRKERHGSDPREPESNNGGSDRIQDDQNFLPTQPTTTRPHHNTTLLQHASNISSSGYQTPYPQHSA